MNGMKKTIVVGMSGGVDSAVSAYLLKEQGHTVIGVYMKNWEDDAAAVYRNAGIGCSWEEDMADVRAVCTKLGIPFLTLNFVQEYKERVFSDFVSELEAGRTPNPDILCNQEIKFELFLERALAIPDVTHVATGHYAKVTEMPNGEKVITRPKDREKDQTYFLYRMPQSAIEHVVFPLADLEKTEVRAIAQEQGFVNARKKDSTGICFIGDIDYRTFVQQYIQKKPGTIVTTRGDVIGQHDGLHLFTIGQRKGIDIGGTGPYYVVEKNVTTNELIVTNDSNDPLLYHGSCTIQNVHWLVPESYRKGGAAQGVVRYRQTPEPVEYRYTETGVEIIFKNPQRAITPGQSAVLYDGDVLLGGGIIHSYGQANT